MRVVSRVPNRLASVVTTALACGVLACGEPPRASDEIPVGLMLSYSGYLAASSVNSERALIMAIEAANAGGGIDGRRLRLEARDTRSNASKVGEPARELLAADVALVIGPDTTDLASTLRSLFEDRTLLLPSFHTSSDVDFKPANWFVMGPSIARVACELVAQTKVDGRQKPVVIVNPTGYNSALSWELGNRYGLPKHVLPTDGTSTRATVRPITALPADAYILAAFPGAASSLMQALTALGVLTEPTRWYLSPTLHTPAFLESIPNNLLKDARGVSPGTIAGAAGFRARFRERWDDVPLDDAYAFYDAGAVAALALQRALVQEGAIPSGTGLAQHLRGVTRASGNNRVRWDEIAQGLELLRAGQEINYIGLSGPLEFDQAGQTPAAATNWWVVGAGGFADVSNESDCR